MNVTITNLPNSGYPYTGETHETALKSVNNNLTALYNILKNYEGKYFDTVEFSPEFRDEYAYKKVTKDYTPAHEDEEVFFRNRTLSTDLYPNFTSDTSNNYTVVADTATPSSSQIRISDVTPVPPEGVNVGDSVDRVTRRLVRNCANMEEGGRYSIKCKSGGLTLHIRQIRDYGNTSVSPDTNGYDEYFEPNSTSRPRRGVGYSVFNEYTTTVDFIKHDWSTGSSATKEECRVYSVVELDNAVGISFADVQTASSSSAHAYLGGYDLIITKSEKGKTVILSPSNIILIRETSTSSYNTLYTAAKRRLTSTTDDTVNPTFFNTNAYTYDECSYHEKTILLNIPCCGTVDDYTKDVFVVPFTQYKFTTRHSTATISINGHQFFYTGFFAIRG